MTTTTTRPSRRRILAMAAGTAAVTAALTIAAAQPAAAESVDPWPVSPYGAVRVSWGATTATVCAWGEVDNGIYIAGVWTLTVAGARADGLPLAGAGAPGVGPSYSDCVTVTTGALAASLVGTLTYAGAGTADPVGVAGAVGVRTLATTPTAVYYSTSG